MKKLSIYLAALMVLFAFSASAAGKEIAAPAEQVYKNAKEAMTLISYGEYAMAIQKLNIGEICTEKMLKGFVDKNCPEIYRGSVQTDVSVAWHDGTGWYLAVPFEAPEDEAVGALVFMLNGNDQFQSIHFARWGEVQSAYASSSNVFWNVEYVPGYVIVGDW